MSLDPVLIVGSLIVITIACGESFDGPDLVLALIAFSLTFPGNLSLIANPWAHLKEILLSWAVIVLILLFFGYATKYLDGFNPIVIATWIAFVPVVLYVAHRTLPLVLPKLLKIEGYRSAVIVGVSEPGRNLAEQFGRSRFLGVDVVGFFDDRSVQRLGAIPAAGLKGRLADLPEFAKERGVEEIFIALPMASQPRILKLLDELRDTTTSIYFVPDMFMTDLIQARIDDVNGIPVVAVCESPFYGVSGLVKRLEDLVLGALVLVLVSPLLVNDRDRGEADLARAGHLQAAALRPGRQGDPGLQVPHYAGDGGWRHRRAGNPPGSARHAVRGVSTPDLPRRAASVRQRAAGADERRRSAAARGGA